MSEIDSKTDSTIRGTGGPPVSLSRNMGGPPMPRNQFIQAPINRTAQCRSHLCGYAQVAPK